MPKARSKSRTKRKSKSKKRPTKRTRATTRRTKRVKRVKRVRRTKPPSTQRRMKAKRSLKSRSKSKRARKTSQVKRRLQARPVTSTSAPTPRQWESAFRTALEPTPLGTVRITSPSPVQGKHKRYLALAVQNFANNLDKQSDADLLGIIDKVDLMSQGLCPYGGISEGLNMMITSLYTLTLMRFHDQLNIPLFIPVYVDMYHYYSETDRLKECKIRFVKELAQALKYGAKLNMPVVVYIGLDNLENPGSCRHAIALVYLPFPAQEKDYISVIVDTSNLIFDQNDEDCRKAWKTIEECVQKANDLADVKVLHGFDTCAEVLQIEGTCTTHSFTMVLWILSNYDYVIKKYRDGGVPIVVWKMCNLLAQKLVAQDVEYVTLVKTVLPRIHHLLAQLLLASITKARKGLDLETERGRTLFGERLITELTIGKELYKEKYADIMADLSELISELWVPDNLSKM